MKGRENTKEKTQETKDETDTKITQKNRLMYTGRKYDKQDTKITEERLEAREGKKKIC